mgnify:CR=1 FL=1
MKTMTCKQMGGACDDTFSAETFEEMVELSKAHGMEMFQKQDAAHLAIMGEMKAVMEKEMTKRVETCQKNEIKSHLKVVTGLAAEEILKIVKNQKIDLIVMAKRRKLKGIKGLLTLGSVSRKIVENTSCPVLLMDAEKK